MISIGGIKNFEKRDRDDLNFVGSRKTSFVTFHWCSEGYVP